MRQIIIDKNKVRPLLGHETIDDLIRADEVDWMPLTLHGETWHTLVNDEDFCRDKDEKLRLRRQKRKMKFRNAHV